MLFFNQYLTLIPGDCRKLLKFIPDSSIDMIATDPPYFMRYMDGCWNAPEISAKSAKAGLVKGLPVGMKFEREQSQRLLDFMLPISREFFRVLKPGAFCAVFSLARLYHAMAQSLDQAGFEIRDMMAWKYEGQAKAFSMSHFIQKDMTIPAEGKEALIKSLDKLKTPQLKPQMEPIVLAQKPREGTFVENWLKWGTGLMDCSQSLDGRFPGNVMEIPKHSRERNSHPTRKPVGLIGRIINLFTREGQTVLDPFMGSGAHGMTALRAKRKFIGFELDPGYFGIALESLKKQEEDISKNVSP